MLPRPLPATRWLPALALLAAALGFVGCSRMSVAQLEARPWRAGTAEVMTMKYWRFTYTTVLTGEAYGLRGQATPVPAVLPPWADRIEELTITAYLRDASGTVLARAEKTYPGLKLDAAAAVPFAFNLVPDGAVSIDDLAVSFGYKALYGSSSARNALPAQGQAPAGTVFFASEGAYTRQ